MWDHHAFFKNIVQYLIHQSVKLKNDFRVQVFEKNGEFVQQIGGKGEDPGFFMYPYGVAADADDNVFVCDLGKYMLRYK